MLLALWSPKGGSGTSVVGAALALVAAERGPARLADLGGDLEAILGLPSGVSPVTRAGPATATAPGGLAGWLAAGPPAPTEWLDEMAVPVAPSLCLLPRGPGEPGDAPAEAGAALAVALRDAGLTVLDTGDGATPAARAAIEVADCALLVIRPCYLAMRRAAADPGLERSAGVILMEEPGRALDAADVAAVLGRPVVGRVAVRPDVARAVDAGVLRDRLPATLRLSAAAVLDELGSRAA